MVGIVSVHCNVGVVRQSDHRCVSYIILTEHSWAFDGAMSL